MYILVSIYLDESLTVGAKMFIFLLHTFKCNLTELTTKNACVSVVVSGVLICACTRILCAPGLRRSGSLHSDSVYSERCFCTGALLQEFPIPSLPLSAVDSV